jgi:hypothetical protein
MIIIISFWKLYSCHFASYRTVPFIGHLLTHLSSWSVALLSADRAVTVARPLSRLPSSANRSRRQFVAVWLVMLVVLIGTNAHFYWTMKLYTDEDISELFSYFMRPKNTPAGAVVVTNTTLETTEREIKQLTG